jgi:hypothetical protein
MNELRRTNPQAGGGAKVPSITTTSNEMHVGYQAERSAMDIPQGSDTDSKVRSIATTPDEMRVDYQAERSAVHIPRGNDIDVSQPKVEQQDRKPSVNVANMPSHPTAIAPPVNMEQQDRKPSVNVANMPSHPTAIAPPVNVEQQDRKPSVNVANMPSHPTAIAPPVNVANMSSNPTAITPLNAASTTAGPSQMAYGYPPHGHPYYGQYNQVMYSHPTPTLHHPSHAANFGGMHPGYVAPPPPHPDYQLPVMGYGYQHPQQQYPQQQYPQHQHPQQQQQYSFLPSTGQPYMPSMTGALATGGQSTAAALPPSSDT